MPKEIMSRSRQTVYLEGNGRRILNPVLCKEGRGLRNFACQHYDACLDKAAKGMWSGFTCKQCDLYQQKDDGGF